MDWSENDDKATGPAQGLVLGVFIGLVMWTVIGLVVIAWWKWWR